MSYRGPKARLIRKFGEDFTFSTKYSEILKRRPNPPGQHGSPRRQQRTSDYGRRLFEKQKLKAIYNISESQLLLAMQKARRARGAAGTNLLQMMEQRLDNVVFRLGFSTTIWSARQLVNHGHIRVDGRKVDIPSFRVRPGQVISLRERTRDNVQIVASLAGRGDDMIPPYLSLDRQNKIGTVMRLPERSEMPITIDESLIVEFYSGR